MVYIWLHMHMLLHNIWQVVDPHTQLRLYTSPSLSLSWLNDSDTTIDAHSLPCVCSFFSWTAEGAQLKELVGTVKLLTLPRFQHTAQVTTPMVTKTLTRKKKKRRPLMGRLFRQRSQSSNTSQRMVQTWPDGPVGPPNHICNILQYWMPWGEWKKQIEQIK